MAIENFQRLIGARDTKANIEALTGTLEEQAIAYASDTGEFGIYTNGAWVWFTTSPAGVVGEILQDDDGEILTDDDGNILYEDV